ncbi:translocator protein 2 isoform X2 [Cavia porcellus]|uniref:translocator protein 2 isoform X2 n=1 Tax=Cavia porcellus TaxID=10141 RepID=UPI002FE2B808
MHPTLPLQGTGVPKTEASACQGFQPALFLYLLIVPCLVHPSPSPWVSKNAHSSFPTSVLQRAPSRNLRTHSTVFLPPSLPSYASYLVWKDLGGGFKWRLALPLGLYAFQLPISWVVLMLFLEAANPGLALLTLLLLYGLVVSMVLVWHPINKLAALLLLPYLAWLTVTAVLTYRLWRDSLCLMAQPQPTGEKGS